MNLFADIPLQLADADLRYQPDWLDAETADAWLQALMREIPWEQPIVQVHGRRLPVPRLVAWYADPGVRLSYSGLSHRALSWTPLLERIRRRVEEAAGQAFNGVLINHYRDGQDSMGWHADDERYLGRDPVIAALNLGGVRRFDLRRKGQSRIEHSLTLGHGSLLIMGGTTQHHWQHQVAKTRKPCAPRLNLTFRHVRPQPR